MGKKLRKLKMFHRIEKWQRILVSLLQVKVKFPSKLVKDRVGWRRYKENNKVLKKNQWKIQEVWSNLSVSRYYLPKIVKILDIVTYKAKKKTH